MADYCRDATRVSETAHRLKSKTSQQTVSALNFLRLPPEIQVKICQLFCRHCYSATSSPSVTLSAPAGASFQTLKALSETCHALSRTAQPILYHYPDVKAYTPFFRTVIAHPSLAASVRVLARLYEAAWDPSRRGPRPERREDFAYLIDLGRQFNLNDDGSGPEDPDRDIGAEDDTSFKRCFECLFRTANGDDEGYTRTMARAAYKCLLTAIHFAVLPKLQFALIDLNDGREWIRNDLLSSGQLLFEYPYLKRAVAAYPGHFLRVDSIVFRDVYHYKQENLGLESVAFLLSAIPNVRAVFFKTLRGIKPEAYKDLEPFPKATELSWPALPHLEEAYFDPCMRSEDPAPILAISNMLQRCSKLKKMVYRHKYPDQHQPVLFSPVELLHAITSTKSTLEHLEIYCNSAKIPSFPSEYLLNYKLQELASLNTLALDEEIFCSHWLSDSYPNTCLTSILPKNIATLIIRLHDKFRAVSDIVQIGLDKRAGYYPQLSHLRVDVLHDTAAPDDPYNSNRDPEAFDAAYHLHAMPPAKWEMTLRELADSIRPEISKAFHTTGVVVHVQYIYEDLFLALQ